MRLIGAIALAAFAVWGVSITAAQTNSPPSLSRQIELLQEQLDFAEDRITELESRVNTHGFAIADLEKKLSDLER